MSKPSPRNAAIDQGRAVYVSETPCRYGHEPVRYCANGGCVACVKLTSRKAARNRFAKLAQWSTLEVRVPRDQAPFLTLAACLLTTGDPGRADDQRRLRELLVTLERPEDRNFTGSTVRHADGIALDQGAEGRRLAVVAEIRAEQEAKRHDNVSPELLRAGFRPFSDSVHENAPTPEQIARDAHAEAMLKQATADVVAVQGFAPDTARKGRRLAMWRMTSPEYRSILGPRPVGLSDAEWDARGF